MSPLSAGARIIRPLKETETHRAKWVIAFPWRIVENGAVVVENGVITEISKGSRFSGCIDHGPGVLMPPLVNAHTHLEFSFLKSAIDCSGGFEQWVRQLIHLRENTDPRTVEDGARLAVADLLNAGVLYIGEIATSGITRQIVEDSDIGGVWFREFLGTEAVSPPTSFRGASVLFPEGGAGPGMLKTVLFKLLAVLWKTAARLTQSAGRGATETGKVPDRDLYISVAGHAPHTTSPSLLKQLKRTARSAGLPFSIHAAESRAELDFITGPAGEWADLLRERGIDFSTWQLPSRSPVVHLENLRLLDAGTLLVHLLEADPEDFEIIARSGARVCVCPRSNMNLHGRLPDIDRMIACGIRPALGTDSLASCDSLDIFDEMAYTAANFENLPPEVIFSMATQNGAEALSLGADTGSLEPGKNGHMLYLPVEAKDRTGLMEKITGYEPHDI